ncbi:MAG TPA: hypothetical protein DCX13_05270, partial [Rhodobacteraceae bacterium]|nr:hypothetical protein [Paracoccaceae bacterium]
KGLGEISPGPFCVELLCKPISACANHLLAFFGDDYRMMFFRRFFTSSQVPLAECAAVVVALIWMIWAA